MKLKELISIASDAYPDGLIEQCFLRPSGNHGDGLAKFIASELKDTFDSNEPTRDQLDNALGVMESAKQELEAVIEAIYEKMIVAKITREKNK